MTGRASMHRQLRPRPGEPSLSDVISSAIEANRRTLRTGMPGIVQSYSKAKKVADVQPAIKGVIFTADGEPKYETLPIVANVPVGWLRGGGASFQMKLVKGDSVWLLFSEAAMAVWRLTGQISEPGDLRMHDLSYACAIPCISPDAGANELPEVADDESAVLDGPDKLRIGGPSAGALATADDVFTELHKIQLSLASLSPPVAYAGPANAAAIGTTKLVGE